MALAGLILAENSGESPDGDHPALLSIAGQSLIEYQARAAHASGASHIVILVDKVPGPMVAAFDRLRSDGIGIEIARDARDAADRIHPDERLLLINAATVAGREVFNALARASDPVLLTQAEEATVEHFERIDRENRWTGLALLTGAYLRETSAMLGDWTLGPTLLRIALQKGCARVPLANGQAVVLVRDRSDAASATAKISFSLPSEGAGLTGPRLIEPAAQIGALQAMKSAIPFDFLAVAGPVLSAAALLLAWIGWNSSAFLALLLAMAAASIARRVGRTGFRNSRLLAWQARLEPILLAILALLPALQPVGVDFLVLILGLWFASGLFLDQEGDWSPGPADGAMVLMVFAAAGQTGWGLCSIVAWQIAARIKKLRQDKALATP